MGSTDKEEGWYRANVGRRIERGVNRLIGMAFLALAAIVALVSWSSDSFTLATHWPNLAVVALFLFLARLCFRAKKSVIEEFGEEPSGNSARKP